MEQLRHAVTPARVRRARAFKAGRLAGVLMALGWDVAFVVWRGNWDVIISAAAFWLVTVLFLLSAWELLMLLTGAEGIGVLPRGKWMARLETWLVPAGLVAGLLLGHYLWA
jgi:hypothetical protein